MREVKVQEVISSWFNQKGFRVSENIKFYSKNKIDLVAVKNNNTWIIEVKGDYDKDPAQYSVNFDTAMGQILKSITIKSPEIQYAICIPFSRTERKERLSYRLILQKYSESIVFEELNISLILVRDDKSVEIIDPFNVKDYLKSIETTSKIKTKIVPKSLHRYTSSKYDKFWNLKREDLTDLLEEAFKNGKSRKLEVSEIRNYGTRSTWYGVVEVSDETLRRGEMAHLKSLGTIILRNNLQQQYTDISFRLVLTEDLELQVFTIKNRKNTDKIPSKAHGTFERKMRKLTYPKIENNINNKIVYFIPCCKRKNPSGRIIDHYKDLNQKNIPKTWHLLLQGRRSMQNCINPHSPLTSAIHLYTGAPYNSFSMYKSSIIQNLQSNMMELVIISAGYGIVNALESINDYEAELKGLIARTWRDNGLINVISELLITSQPSVVVGFFAGVMGYSSPGSKYRYFFSEGLNKALTLGLKIKLGGCFYRKDGRGAQAILGALGRTFIGFLTSQNRMKYTENIETNGRKDGNVEIRFDRMI